jgi:4-amino-4-deoxy-L-arabinose transferase-like glycosyltransferase
MSARPKLVLAVVLAIALAVRVAVVVASPDYRPYYDSGDYVRHAVSIGSGHGFPDSVFTASESPSAFRPPLYPYLLGGVYLVFGEVTTAGRLAGALFGVLAVLLVYLVARRLWDDRTGLVAAALAAVFPGLFLLTGALITEPVYLAIELAAVLFALHSRARGGDLRWAAAAGACCGLAALTRSNGMLLLLPIAFGLLVLRPRLSRAALAPPAVAVAVTFLVVAPWAVRNSLAFDRPVGFNGQTGFGLAGIYNDLAYDRDGYRGTWTPPQLSDRYRPLYDRRDLDEVELDAELRRRAVDWAADHPGYVLEASAYNGLRMLELVHEHPFGFRANRLQMGLGSTAARVERASFYLLALLALAGLVAIRRMPPGRRPPLFVWAIPLLTVVAAFPIIGSTRYRTVAYPFLVLAAAPALVAGADRVTARRRARVAA